MGTPRIYADPDEPEPQNRKIVREEINPVEADVIRDAAMRVLEHGIGRVDRAGLNQRDITR